MSCKTRKISETAQLVFLQGRSQESKGFRASTGVGPSGPGKRRTFQVKVRLQLRGCRSDRFLGRHARDLQGAKWIAPKHAGIICDVYGFAIMPGDALDNPFGDAAQLAVGRIHDLQFVSGAANAMEDRRLSARVPYAHGNVNQPLGVFNEVERLPLWLNELPIEANQLGSEELAKGLQNGARRHIEVPAGGTDQSQQFLIGVNARGGVRFDGEVGLSKQILPSGNTTLLLRESLQLKKDQSVHRDLMYGVLNGIAGRITHD
jgi:hypothetical protein